MNDLERYLHATFSVDSLDLAQMAAHFQPVQLDKGDFFLRSGRYCDKLAFVQQGLIRIYAEVEGREVTQWISTQGYFITDLASFLFQVPARWHMQALTDCQLFVINRQTYQGLGKQIAKWNELDKRFIARCFTLLEDRIFSHLYHSAEERYRNLLARQPELFNQVPLQYLASMLGMTPETLSRLRKKALR